jgi:hypothetical protein
VSKKASTPVALSYSEPQRNIGKVSAFSLSDVASITASPQALAKLCVSAFSAAGTNWSMAEIEKGREFPNE